jgi:HAD superfamily hydrolase (TIGR01509 family)
MPGAFSSKRHLLFDLDGTLVNSVPMHERAFVETLQVRHPDLAENFDYAIFAGWPTRDVFVALGFREESELTELTARKQRLYREAVARGEVEVFPGAKALLARLQEKGRSLYLVTGASRISTQRILEVTGLVAYFQGITTADDAHPGKPSPEPYRYTLARYNLEPHDCLAIEDSESGIRSACDAGLAAVLIHADFPFSDVIQTKNCEELAALLLP